MSTVFHFNMRVLLLPNIHESIPLINDRSLKQLFCGSI